MSILLPDRNGVWSTIDDSRMSLVSTAKATWLAEDYSILMIGVGDIIPHEDYYDEYYGGVNVRFQVLGNHTGTSSSPGYWGLTHVGPSEGYKYQLKFRPNGGGAQLFLSVDSPNVTHDNTAYVVIERNVDDYAIHLYDKDGVKTAGTPASHNANSAGLFMRSSHRTVFVGSDVDIQSTQVSGHWRGMLENMILVEQGTAFTNMDTKIANIIKGSDPVTEFGATETKIWRTLEDLTSAGLDAESTATSDTLPSIVEAAYSRALVGSPIAAVSTQSVRLDERKYNFYGLHGDDTTSDIAVSGDYFGSVTNVEGRLIDLSDESEYQTWQTLESSVSGNTWSGTFTGVEAGEYGIELRPSNATSNVYKGRNFHTVAHVFLWHGQSQVAYNFIFANNNLTGGITLDEPIPATSRAYYVEERDGPTNEGSMMRMSGSDDYNDALAYAQVEWERIHPNKPVVWVYAARPGSSLLDWLNGDWSGDGVTDGSGLMTTLKYTLNTDKVNILYNWGTSDLSVDPATYDGYINGWLYDEAGDTDYSGVTYDHFTDFFDADFGLSILPITGHKSGAADNFTADPVEDDYANQGLTTKREKQTELVTEWSAAKSSKVILGPSINDYGIEAAGGPHPPTSIASEGETRYKLGMPRMSSRMGLAAAWLADSSTYTVPTIGTANFSLEDKTQFKVAVSTGTFGALKNGEGTSAVSGFEISTDNGVTWNRKGFSAAISGSDVLLTKSTGDWSSVPDGELLWRYHWQGPYSYGSSYVAESDAAMLQALYATNANEDGLGVPVHEKTNGADGGLSVGAYVAPAVGCKYFGMLNFM